jgi:hypothetical protein
MLWSTWSSCLYGGFPVACPGWDAWSLLVLLAVRVQHPLVLELLSGGSSQSEDTQCPKTCPCCEYWFEGVQLPVVPWTCHLGGSSWLEGSQCPETGFLVTAGYKGSSSLFHGTLVLVGAPSLRVPNILRACPHCGCWLEGVHLPVSRWDIGPGGGS